MKHVFLALALITTLGFHSASANDGKISPVVRESFRTQFAEAAEPVWTEVNGLFRAEFTDGDEKKYAYYNASGELVVVGRPINREKLSRQLQSDLKKRFANYSVVEVYEFSTEERTDYGIVLQQNETKLTLRSTGGKWNKL